MHRRVIVWVGLIVLAGMPAAMGQGRGRGQGNANSASAAAGSTAVPGGFGTEDRRIIIEWFHDSKNLSGLPPGLAKREELTPGLQKQLTRNGKLPPGLEKQIQQLPTGLEVLLPRLPDGRKRVIIGGNVIILDTTTSLIVDILTGIF